MPPVDLLPRFYQVKQSLMREIVSSGLAVGDVMPSSRQIAEKYGVSYLTARRSVEELIADGVLKREHGRMAKVAQIPDIADTARDLPSRRTGNVYLFTGSGLIKQPEGYSAGIYRAIEAVLRKQGWNPMLRMIRHYTNVPEMVTEEVRSENVDGCIIVCYYKEPVAQALFSSGIPCISIDFTPDTVPMDCVVTNNRSIATRLMVDLFELGHTTVDFVGHFHQPPLRDSDAEELEFYWRKALIRGSASGEAHYLYGDDQVREYAERLVTSDNAPTALLASNPGTANDILRDAKRLGLNVPEDLSIVTLGGGFAKDMRVSSVNIDWFEMARMAVQRLADLISGEGQPGARLTYAGEFVDRGTTGPATSGHSPATPGRSPAREKSVRRHRGRE